MAKRRIWYNKVDNYLREEVGDLAEIRGINRTNDYAFKHIFGSEEGKEALLSFLNTVLKLPPGRELADVGLLDREIDPRHLLDRSARLDVLARTKEGTLINIEIQVANQDNIDKRTMYYWAALYHGQLTSGQQFADLRKTVTINIPAFRLVPGRQPVPPDLPRARRRNRGAAD